MEAIVAHFDVADMSVQQYEQTLNDLGGIGAGCLHHVAARKGDGMVVIDVWESEEALNEFSKTLIPILQSHGVTPVQPVVLPVQNMLTGAAVAAH
jgi:hypothetical protein